MFEHITSDISTLPPEDENRHDLSALPGTREAAVYMLPLPEYDGAGIIYTWVTSEGKAGASVTFFGPGLGETIDERVDQIDVPATMDFYNWDVGGLQLKIDTPFETAQFAYMGKRIEMEFRFEAMHPAFPFSAHRKGCPPYYAINRTEQHGTVKGYFKLDGKEYALDNSFCQRDRAWGPRIWGLNQHYKWFHATTSHAAVHFFELQSFGRVHQLGYVFKENHMAEITSLKHDFTFDDNMHHTSINVVAHDSSGRITSLSCRTIAQFVYPVDPMIQLNESPIAVTIEGREGAGWCEFCWNKNYLDFAREHIHFGK
jgi:hypothetical protein